MRRPPGFSTLRSDGLSYSRSSNGITVTVRSIYLEDQSDPERSSYVWAYQVRIENHRPDTVQLLRRTWQITDGRGRVQVVEGDGVIGEQPLLEPGEAFEYTSGTPLETPSGIMVGLYHMVATTSGERFDAEIPAFSLDGPGGNRRLH